MKKHKILISNQTVFLIFGLIITLYFTFLIREVLVLVFLAFIISSAIRPLVDKLETYNLPRPLSIFLIYSLIILFILFVFAITIDAFVRQTEEILRNSPEIAENFVRNLNDTLPENLNIDSETRDSLVETLQENFSNLEFQNIAGLIQFAVENFSNVSTTGIRILNSAIGVFFSGFVILVASAFLTVRKERIYDNILNFIPRDTSKVRELLVRIEKGLGTWAFGLFILMLLIGLLSYIALIIPYLLGVDGYEMQRFALLVAVVAGINEALPNIGPTISTVLVVLLAVALAQSLGIIIYLIISFIAIQQIEGIFVAPKIMQRVADLDPVLTIFGLVAGFELGGIVGAVISLPIIISIQVSARYFKELYKDEIDKSKQVPKVESSLQEKLVNFVSFKKTQSSSK